MDKTWRMTEEEFKVKAVKYLDEQIKLNERHLDEIFEKSKNKSANRLKDKANKSRTDEIIIARTNYNLANKKDVYEYIKCGAELLNVMDIKFYQTSPMDFDEIIMLLLLNELTGKVIISYSFMMEYNTFNEDQIKDIIFIQSGFFDFKYWNDDCVNIITMLLVSDKINKVDEVIEEINKSNIYNNKELVIECINQQVEKSRAAVREYIDKKEKEIENKELKIRELREIIQELTKLTPEFEKAIQRNLTKVSKETNTGKVASLLSDIIKETISTVMGTDNYKKIKSYSIFYQYVIRVQDYGIKPIITRYEKESDAEFKIRELKAKEERNKALLGMYDRFISHIKGRRYNYENEISHIKTYIDKTKTAIENKRNKKVELTINLINRLDWYYLDNRYNISPEFRQLFAKFVAKANTIGDPMDLDSAVEI